MGASWTMAGGRAIVTAKIPLDFRVADNQLPAGDYAIWNDETRPATLAVEDKATGKKIIVTYVTRLAARDNARYLLVCDKAGEKATLSEIHLAHVDGYLVSGGSAKPTYPHRSACKGSMRDARSAGTIETAAATT